MFSNIGGRIACFQSQAKEQLALKHGLNIVFSNRSGRTACSQTWVEQCFQSQVKKQLALKYGLNSVFSNMSGRTACSLTRVEEQLAPKHRFLKHLRKNLFCYVGVYKHHKYLFQKPLTFVQSYPVSKRFFNSADEYAKHLYNPLLYSFTQRGILSPLHCVGGQLLDGLSDL